MEVASPGTTVWVRFKSGRWCAPLPAGGLGLAPKHISGRRYGRKRKAVGHIGRDTGRKGFPRPPTVAECETG